MGESTVLKSGNVSLQVKGFMVSVIFLFDWTKTSKMNSQSQISCHIMSCSLSVFCWCPWPFSLSRNLIKSRQINIGCCVDKPGGQI